MSQTYTFKVERDQVYMICWQAPDNPIGNAGPIEVK